MNRNLLQRLTARSLPLMGIGLGVAALAAGTPATADVIVSYDMTYATSSRSEVHTVHPDVTASEYTAHGDTEISTSKTHFIRVDSGDHAGKIATIEASVLNNEFGQFEVTVTPGMQLNLSSLGIGMQLTRGADNESFTVHLRSSLDNFASDIDVATLMGDSGVNVIDGFGTFDLSDAAFQGLTGSVTFRLYMVTNISSRKSEGSQYIRITPDVVLNGTVSPIPEPGSLALCGLGSVLMLRRRRRGDSAA